MVNDAVDEEFDRDVAELPAFLGDPLGVLQRRGRLMALVFVLGIVATIAVFLHARPTYEAVATILIQQQQISEDFVQSTVQENTFQVINALLGRVLARESLARLLEKNDLYPDLREEMTTEEMVTVMRKNIDVAPTEGFKLQLNRRNEGARILAVSFQYREPRMAAKIANDLARAIADESLRSRSEKARITTEFLRREFKRVETALYEQNQKIVEFQQEYAGELPSELDSILRHLERLQLQRQSLALRISESESRLASITISIQEAQPLSPAEEHLQELRFQLAEAEGVYSEKHPTVLSIRRQISILEKDITAERAQSGQESLDRNSLVAATRKQIEVQRRQLEEVGTKIDELNARVARMPAHQEEFTRLERTVLVLNDNFTEAMRKVKEAELAQSLETAQHGSRLAVLDMAQPPIKPNANRLKLALAGCVASVGLAVLLGCLLELLDTVLLTSRQIESITGAPVLGAIPKV